MGVTTVLPSKSTIVTDEVLISFDASRKKPGHVLNSFTREMDTEDGAALIQFKPVFHKYSAPPPGLAIPPVQVGWSRLPLPAFTPSPFGANPPGWYGPYSYGTGDTAMRNGHGHGEWVNAKTVMVGPGTCPVDGLVIPPNVLDICQNNPAGIPYSAVLIPDLPSYNYNKGATEEWVHFMFRTVNQQIGWKIICAILWNDSNTGNEEIDTEEDEFSLGWDTLAVHFPNGQSEVPYLGVYAGKPGYSLASTGNVWDNSKWTLGSQRRLIDTAGVGHLDFWLSQDPAFDITTTPPVFSIKDGDDFTQWGGKGTVVVPKTSMHVAIQAETSTLTQPQIYQPAVGSVDHIQFEGYAIDLAA